MIRSRPWVRGDFEAETRKAIEVSHKKWGGRQEAHRNSKRRLTKDFVFMARKHLAMLLCAT